ncbi:bifunctional tRNA (5-methylaminomethyl-2-thiouridine)(34)-methyltransferase MnmD/FAD-dependent 5-carboxymethylaminomethyl-2-thiouridine(34) oxidoreductase MnmC [Marinicella rhabdoformis]|uniref:bifunctional tRNA (5-methylaminomethyl-2-thiouridine)(34)-methyltransferase MnmD/FAD-dependent 5-carboxymethylaminomethyl-2-thiouridine(34) oxidoreductase MnmC n=1 Tax=Marinicella rhabdoformis TaxID=2580566 RepID=UPI0012AEB7D3|nr:bifunctional tRNA (5-methylaminomethyl-2-thiouridine)(34)-methyltransferase MnmD/FAD-dependent 5-carboxymethylaminomethyl-2-thiouridine(34) oxidoreductase MnmC [Marinicella rhabdoformis]
MPYMNPLSMALAPKPQVEEKDGLRSIQFNDIYFNNNDVIATATHDYLNGNDLSERWKALASEETFVVAETGFGTGLNLLLLLRMWQDQTTKPKQLHFISCELFPLNKQQLQTALKGIPELQSEVKVLLKHYPEQRLGFHRFQLANDVFVTLMLGDAVACYDQCHAEVDAWFLDGFDPKKNPEMWSDDLFNQVARLSKSGTTLSTYTAASQVRRQLQAVGFEVNKRKGYGKKREIITAVMPDGESAADTSAETVKQNWAPTKAATVHQDIVVLGGGIAGLSVVRACAQSGHPVTLVDKAVPMQAASGNPKGMVMPYLTAQSSPEALFYWRAFDLAVQAYLSDSDSFQSIGIKEWCETDKKQLWKKTLFKDHHWPDDLIQSTNQGVLYPSAGVIDTQSLKDQWLPYANEVIEADVVEIKKVGEHWLLLDSHQKVIKSCDVLVVTAGIHSLKFDPFAHLPLVPKHGQVSLIHSQETLPFSQVQRHQGYAIPMSENRCLLGATFDHMHENDWYDSPRLEDSHALRNAEKWDGFHHWQLPNHQVISGKAGIRTTTPDHLPVCGTVVDSLSFKIDYADLHHGRHWQQYPEAKTNEGLYLMTGLGARGFTSAPLLGQLLADMILGRPLPLEQSLCQQLHPNRFLYRQLKKSPK